jgi:hypothetical protein
MRFMIHRLSQILKERGRGAAAKLAKDADMPQSIVSDLCSGKDRLNETHIEAISAALKIPAWHLFADPKDVIPPSYIRLMEDYMRLDPTRRQIVDDILTAARVSGSEAPDKPIKKRNG